MFFEVVIPGSPVIKSFQETMGVYHCDVFQPRTVQAFSIYLNSPLPDSGTGPMALAAYYSVPPYSSLEFIGAVANLRPSDVFSTGFGLRPETNNLQILKLVFKLEPLAGLEQAIKLTYLKDAQKEYALKVAQNLYNFMMSYQREVAGIGPNLVVMPQDFLDRWIKKFQQNYALDKNFILKTKME